MNKIIINLRGDMPFAELTAREFVQKSLDLNLFFLRIMMEHSLFIKAAFVPKNNDLAMEAEQFKQSFNLLLAEAVGLANGNASQVTLDSGEVVTNRTLQAEERTQFLSGIAIDTDLTRKETMLRPGTGDAALESAVSDLNERVITEVAALVEFKTRILNSMLDCSLFTWNFPLLIEHIRREAQFFITHLRRLQQRTQLDPTQEIIEEKIFWDRIMAEHSQFIAHLLDPTQTNLITTANNFAAQFFALESRAKQVEENNTRVPQNLMNDEISATNNIRTFKNTAEELILACQIRSLIIPLLADHVLREANHFYALLTHTSAPTIILPARSRSRRPLRRRRR